MSKVKVKDHQNSALFTVHHVTSISVEFFFTFSRQKTDRHTHTDRQTDRLTDWSKIVLNISDITILWRENMYNIIIEHKPATFPLPGMCPATKKNVKTLINLNPNPNLRP